MYGECSKHDNQESILPNRSSAPRNIPLQHLTEITNDFSDERILGQGGLGVVYKGVLPNGETIAVKKYAASVPASQKQFENEVWHLMRLEHPNIVRLIGYCYEIQNVCCKHKGKYVFAEMAERLLCLEYLPKGSLDRYLSDDASLLDWHTCYKIIKGICYGLNYLHEQIVPTLHLDLKPANILLDDNLMPKIADFGLSRLLDRNQTICTSSLNGTLGYMAPEYLHGGRITPKSDIFSLGVIIMEVITGHRDYPYVTTASPEDFMEHALRKWRFELEKTQGCTPLEIYCKQIKRCIQIGLICVNPERTIRPTTRIIINMLQELECTYCDVSSVAEAKAKAEPHHESKQEQEQDPESEMEQETETELDTESKLELEPKPDQVMRAHQDEVLAAQSPNNGKYLASTSDDKFGVVWNGTLQNFTMAAAQMDVHEDSAPPTRMYLHDDCDEYAKLVRRMNKARVTFDNCQLEKATVIQVDSLNTHGTLLAVVEVMADLNLVIHKAYFSSDVSWLMDVFNVTDREGNKLYDSATLEQIEMACDEPEVRDMKYTSIEFTGTDRIGLLSEVCAVLADMQCAVQRAELWTHNTRVAAVMQVTDGGGGAIEDDARIGDITRCLSDLSGVRATAALESLTHMERRLHQLMFDDRGYGAVERPDPRMEVSVTPCAERGYTVVAVRCPDRPRLLFDTVCTLTDMQYVVHHGTVNTEPGSCSSQEYYIRHIDGSPVRSDAERQRLVQCLEAAVERRIADGLELEVRTDDRDGLLSDITRIFGNNGLTIRRAEISSEGGKAVDTFYLSDPLGHPVETGTIEAIRRQIGEDALRVKNNPFVEDSTGSASNVAAGSTAFRFGNLFKLFE